MNAELQIFHLRSALSECWSLIRDLCKENDRLKFPAPKLSSESEVIMDSFVTFIQSYWGKMSPDQSAAAMKLRPATIQGWLSFISTYIMTRLNNGQPVPSAQEIIDEWHKDHAPAQVVSTPFGDVFKPVGTGTQTDLLAELKELVSRYGG